MQRTEKERVIAELTERLRTADSLIVADYRGLTNSDLATLRVELLKHGARFSVVKNTLARRAADAAGSEALLALLEGPTAIAFIESGGDPVAVAKALSDSARDTKILSIRGGMLSGKEIDTDDVEQLAKLPPAEVLRGQLLGAIIAPLTSLAALLAAPVQDLVGLIDARIAQLEEQSDSPAVGEASAAEDVPTAPATDAAAPEAAASAAEAIVEEPAAEQPDPSEEVAAEAAAQPDEASSEDSTEPDSQDTEKNEEE